MDRLLKGLLLLNEILKRPLNKTHKKTLK